MRRLLLFCLLVLGLAVPAQAADPAVRMETSMGTIVLRLDAARAPATVANFVEYVKAGFYDGTIFHRVIPAFMIQGGGFTPDMRQKQTREPIANEADNGLPNVKYSIAMARTGAPHSATAQFFINTRDNAFLNFKSRDAQGWGYAVFGKVVRGQDVVDRIEKVATGSRGLHDDVPRDPVIIKKVTLIQ
ncbi:MAG: peptidylprolyl isomerase [Desulfovibrionaceae bacterium]|nr:peptidylprolyl isomerase [Desulfovibrionaceae bacterium]